LKKSGLSGQQFVEVFWFWLSDHPASEVSFIIELISFSVCWLSILFQIQGIKGSYYTDYTTIALHISSLSAGKLGL
jgi:hypothetical protein